METKARREGETEPFRCQRFVTGVIGNPYEFIDTNTHLSNPTSGPVVGQGADRVSTPFIPDTDAALSSSRSPGSRNDVGLMREMD